MFCIKEYIFDASLFNDNGIHSRYSPQLFIEKKMETYGSDNV